MEKQLKIARIKEDKEPIDLEVIDDKVKVVKIKGHDVYELSQVQKDYIKDKLEIDDEFFQQFIQATWTIVPNNEEINPGYEPSDVEYYPFGLLIAGRFYDALTENFVERILSL